MCKGQTNLSQAAPFAARGQIRLSRPAQVVDGPPPTFTKERTEMTDVVMPQMCESIVEGTLTKWLKKPGERVERDEPLFEISTDKVDTEIPSPAAGTLAEVLIEEGKTVGINTIVARIDEGGGAAASKPASAAAPPKAPPQPETPSQETIQPTVAAQQQVEDTAPAAGGAAPEPAVPAAPAAAEPVGPISPLVR